jgi:hypothetical protein
VRTDEQIHHQLQSQQVALSVNGRIIMAAIMPTYAQNEQPGSPVYLPTAPIQQSALLHSASAHSMPVLFMNDQPVNQFYPAVSDVTPQYTYAQGEQDPPVGELTSG